MKYAHYTNSAFDKIRPRNFVMPLIPNLILFFTKNIVIYDNLRFPHVFSQWGSVIFWYQNKKKNKKINCVYVIKSYLISPDWRIIWLFHGHILNLRVFNVNYLSV